MDSGIQRVMDNSSMSRWRPMTRGVPLQSILGPVWFHIIIDDMCHHHPSDLVLHQVLLSELEGVDGQTIGWIRNWGVVASRESWSMAPCLDGDQ